MNELLIKYLTFRQGGNGWGKRNGVEVGGGIWWFCCSHCACSAIIFSFSFIWSTISEIQLVSTYHPSMGRNGSRRYLLCKHVVLLLNCFLLFSRTQNYDVWFKESTRQDEGLMLNSGFINIIKFKSFENTIYKLGFSLGIKNLHFALSYKVKIKGSSNLSLKLRNWLVHQLVLQI